MSRWGRPPGTGEPECGQREKPLRISNAIYREIILRELTWTTQSGLIQQSAWYMNPDNSINMEKLLSDFRQFFRENADSWVTAAPYIALELKIKRGDLNKTIAKGLEQTVWYMDCCGDVSEGHFIVFNRDKE